MRLRLVGHTLIAALAMVVAACSTKPSPAPKPAPVAEPSVPAQAPETQPSQLVTVPKRVEPDVSGPLEPDAVAKNKAAATPPINKALSSARNSDDYRQDAARHIYQRLPERIYKGKLPPFLKAVVVVDIHIEPSGQVGRIDWVRVPKHSPEVKQDIEQAIRQSAPFPAPKYLKQVSFTETWLWHRSGRFQLDTLTEGQL